MGKPISKARQMARLRVGESMAECQRIEMSEASDETIKTVLAKLRNRINAMVGRERDRDLGSSFRVDSANAINDDKTAVICTVCATCTARDAADDGLGEEDDGEVDI